MRMLTSADALRVATNHAKPQWAVFDKAQAEAHSKVLAGGRTEGRMLGLTHHAFSQYNL